MLYSFIQSLVPHGSQNKPFENDNEGVDLNSLTGTYFRIKKQNKKLHVIIVLIQFQIPSSHAIKIYITNTSGKS